MGRDVFAAVSAAAPVVQTAAQQFVGITTDGARLTGLYELVDEGLDAAPVVRAAKSYLAGLSGAERALASQPVDAVEWQHWINAFLTFPEHGLLLDRLEVEHREADLAVVAATVSVAGQRDIRTAMRLNAGLGELCTGYEDTLKEFMYWFTVFGEPSLQKPWGWQLMGHHIDINCLIVGGQLVLTPTFMGTEYEGHELFAEHIQRGVTLMESFDAAQRDKAVLYRSIMSADLPDHLAGPINGRHRAGAGQDNLVMPYEGVRGDELRPTQRKLLLDLTKPYLFALPDGPYHARLAQVERHLDDTSFSWIGGWGSGEPFYYKIHSPVILIEYDNHSGVFLDNAEPEQYHVHTIVRTPNGNDYGRDLLAQHYAGFH